MISLPVGVAAEMRQEIGKLEMLQNANEQQHMQGGQTALLDNLEGNCTQIRSYHTFNTPHNRMHVQ